MTRVTLDRRSVIGTLVTVGDYDTVTSIVVDHARRAEPLTVAASATHPVTLGWLDGAYGSLLNGMDLVVPDGQPVRWALNALYGAGMRERVYGPTLMLHVCARAAAEKLPVYFYGSSEAVLSRLEANLRVKFPGLPVAGAFSPPFRELGPGEIDAHIQAIRESGARIVFVGLGCPRQERWIAAHRNRIGLPLLALGAAFDFHAGTKPQAPEWMQRSGLEWAFRLWCEPRRLFLRYALFNPLYAVLVLTQWMGFIFPPHPPPTADQA